MRERRVAVKSHPQQQEQQQQQQQQQQCQVEQARFKPSRVWPDPSSSPNSQPGFGERHDFTKKKKKGGEKCRIWIFRQKTMHQVFNAQQGQGRRTQRQRVFAGGPGNTRGKPVSPGATTACTGGWEVPNYTETNETS